MSFHGDDYLADEVNENTMDGDSIIEKRLNSYLTRRFILSHGVPKDECLSEARDIIKMIEEFNKTGA